MFKKINFKDILIRLLKTFVQATIAVLILSLQNGIDITDKETVVAVIVGAVSAGISAVMNLIKEMLK